MSHIDPGHLARQTPALWRSPYRLLCSNPLPNMDTLLATCIPHTGRLSMTQFHPKGPRAQVEGISPKVNTTTLISQHPQIYLMTALELPYETLNLCCCLQKPYLLASLRQRPCNPLCPRACRGCSRSRCRSARGPGRLRRRRGCCP